MSDHSSSDAAAGPTSQLTPYPDELVTLIAHELRSPLAAISNAVVLWRPGTSPQTLANVQDILARQVNKALRLVDDLLDVSRLEFVIVQDRVDLLQVIAEAVQEIEHQIRVHQQGLALELPADPLFVRGDAMRLQQVVVNLLGNASKYSPSGGHITLRLVRESRQAVLRVRDGGRGISPENLPRIFDPFFRAGTSFDPRLEGLGLGLTLAQRVIERHEGTIGAQSDGPNRGSEFTVRLPVIGATAPATDSPVDL